MALIEIDDQGRTHEVAQLPHLRDFNNSYLRITTEEREAIEAEINKRLDQLLSDPDPKWGSITNTSIEGGKPNPETGQKGDWSGTVFDPIYGIFGDEDLAGMLFGNIWKKVIIDRHELWIGIRSDPTFPNRGITLMGKTYFPKDR